MSCRCAHDEKCCFGERPTHGDVTDGYIYVYAYDPRSSLLIDDVITNNAKTRNRYDDAVGSWACVYSPSGGSWKLGAASLQ